MDITRYSFRYPGVCNVKNKNKIYAHTLELLRNMHNEIMNENNSTSSITVYDVIHSAMTMITVGISGAIVNTRGHISPIKNRSLVLVRDFSHLVNDDFLKKSLLVSCYYKSTRDNI